jgi:hypothetical protein
MAEKHYTFLEDNRVVNNAVFAEQDDELAQRICVEQGHDKAIWLDDKETPAMWSTYDGKSFTPPTQDYLISIGVITLEVK